MSSGFFTTDTLRRGNLPDCGACGLYRDCNSPKMEVHGHGSGEILVIGREPGRDGDRVGRPFMGPEGKYVRGVFKAAGLGLDNCWLLNAIVCHPADDVVLPLHLGSCRPTVSRAIRKLKPRVIITLGEEALEAVMPETYRKFGGPISKWRGHHIPCGSLGAWVCPLIDPREVLSAKKGNPILDLLFRQDLVAALDCHGKDRPRQLCLDVDVILDPVEAKRRLERLSTQSGTLAWDYETTCLKPETLGADILSCAFCLDGHDTWACMMPPDLYPSLSKVLKSRRLKKVASNMKFEDRWTRCKLGHGVTAWKWDTMLAAHVIDNRPAISSVKFQALILLGAEPWDGEVSPFMKATGEDQLNRMKFAPKRAMLQYNGVDALVEFLVMEKQMEILGEV